MAVGRALDGLSVPVLVVGRGSNLLVADRGFRRAGGVPRPRVREPVHRGGAGAGRSRPQPSGPGPPHRGRRPARSRMGGRGAGLGRRRHPDERRRARLGHRGHPGRLPVGGPGLGRSARGARRAARLRLPALHRGRHRRGRGRCPPARARPCRRRQGGHRRDRPVAPGQPARGQQRRVGLHQPAGGLGRPADRGLRAQGLPVRDRPRSRPGTPTSSRPTPAGRPTTCTGSSPTCSRWWPGPPACASAPRCAWSGSPRAPSREPVGDDAARRADVDRRPSIDPRIRQRRAAIQRRPGASAPAVDRGRHRGCGPGGQPVSPSSTPRGSAPRW